MRCTLWASIEGSYEPICKYETIGPSSLLHVWLHWPHHPWSNSLPSLPLTTSPRVRQVTIKYSGLNVNDWTIKWNFDPLLWLVQCFAYTVFTQISAMALIKFFDLLWRLLKICHFWKKKQYHFFVNSNLSVSLFCWKCHTKHRTWAVVLIRGWRLLIFLLQSASLIRRQL